MASNRKRAKSGMGHWLFRFICTSLSLLRVKNRPTIALETEGTASLDGLTAQAH